MELVSKFKAEVTRVDTFEITIDKKIWCTTALKEWSNIFIDVKSVKELAAHLSQLVTRQGTKEFYEGFGRVKTIMRDGYPLTQFKKEENEWVPLTDQDYCAGITIKIISEDEDCNVEINRIKEESCTM